MFFPSHRAYVETHFRFRYGFTLLSRRAPEILFDLPFRVEPGKNIPVLLLIKDADRYPLEIERLTATVSTGRGRAGAILLPVRRGPVRDLFHHQLFTLPRPESFSGDAYLNFKLDIKINGRSMTVLNDNLPFRNHLAYRVRLSGESLPSLPGFWYGEPHFHSTFTHDQVEYGVPIEAVPPLARTLGLSWAFVTDHSYDLDERNPLNAGQNRFELVRGQAAAACGVDFLLLPGEEASVRNRRGKTVHLCLVNHPEFLPGFGDSGQSLFRNKSEMDIPEALDKIGSAAQGLAFAAHAGAHEGRLEGPLLNRGRWEAPDFHASLKMMQVWNAALDQTFFRARHRWIGLLLSGRRMTALGGNDAHGDFNRSRRIGFPFLFIREDDRIRFGFVRTAVFSETLTPKGLVDGLNGGRAVITNGPFASIELVEGGKYYGLGSEAPGMGAEVRITALSTPEFGPLREVSLYHGTQGQGEEKILALSPDKDDEFRFLHRLPFTGGNPGYLRAEATSGGAPQGHFCMTNPIYLTGGRAP